MSGRVRAGWTLAVAGIIAAAVALLVGLQRDDGNAAVDVRNAQVRDIVDSINGGPGGGEERTRAKWQSREDRELTIALFVAGVGVVVASAGVVVAARPRVKGPAHGDESNKCRTCR